MGVGITVFVCDLYRAPWQRQARSAGENRRGKEGLGGEQLGMGPPMCRTPWLEQGWYKLQTRSRSTGMRCGIMGSMWDYSRGRVEGGALNVIR